MRTRQKFDPALKARLALAAVRGEKTIAELSSEHGVHATQITQWKQELLHRSSEIFSKPDTSAYDQQQEMADKLHRTIGELKVENDWLKKKLQQLG
jgi:transposase-like protein